MEPSKLFRIFILQYYMFTEFQLKPTLAGEQWVAYCEYFGETGSCYKCLVFCNSHRTLGTIALHIYFCSLEQFKIPRTTISPWHNTWHDKWGLHSMGQDYRVDGWRLRRLASEQNGQNFADDIFKYIFLKGRSRWKWQLRIQLTAKEPFFREWLGDEQALRQYLKS